MGAISIQAQTSQETPTAKSYKEGPGRPKECQVSLNHPQIRVPVALPSSCYETDS